MPALILVSSSSKAACSAVSVHTLIMSPNASCALLQVGAAEVTIQFPLVEVWRVSEIGQVGWNPGMAVCRGLTSIIVQV